MADAMTIDEHSVNSEAHDMAKRSTCVHSILYLDDHVYIARRSSGGH